MSVEKKEKKHFIYVEALPKDAIKIEAVRSQKADKLYFAPSECQFYRIMKNKKGEDKIKKIIPTKKGIVNCVSVDHKPISISAKKFRKEWIRDHPDSVIPPLPQDVSMSSTGDVLPLDPSEEVEIFQDVRRAVDDLFHKHVHLYGRFDILARLLPKLKATFPEKSQEVSKSKDNNKESESTESSEARKERIQQDEDDIVLSDI